MKCQHFDDALRQRFNTTHKLLSSRKHNVKHILSGSRNPWMLCIINIRQQGGGLRIGGAGGEGA